MPKSARFPERTVTPPEPAGDLVGAFLVASTLFFLFLVIASTFRGYSLSPMTWYIARSSGLLLFMVSWLTMATGFALTTKLLDRIIGMHLLFSVHTYALRLWYGFLLLHLVSIALDPYVHFGAKELLVPFADSSGQPWVGFGIAAAQLMLVVGGSALLRNIFGYSIWRAIHYLSIPAFALGIAHGLGAGTDSGNLWVRCMYLGAGASALMMGMYRALRHDARNQDRRSRSVGESDANRPSPRILDRLAPQVRDATLSLNQKERGLHAPVDRRR